MDGSGTERYTRPSDPLPAVDARGTAGVLRTQQHARTARQVAFNGRCSNGDEAVHGVQAGDQHRREGVPALRQEDPYRIIASATVGAIIGGMVLLLLVVGPKERKAPSGSSWTDAATALAAQNASGPAEQQALVEAVESMKTAYGDAPNELKKSALRKERANKIRAALQGKREFKGWVGTLKSMNTTGDGKAYIDVEVAPDIEVKTMNNGFSDMEHHTLIDHGNSLYQAIASLGVGDQVQVSGTFIPADSDFIMESSITEAGSMRAPEFIARFTGVKKLEAGN